MSNYTRDLLRTLLSPKACLRALWVSGIFVFNLWIYHPMLWMSCIENDSLGLDKKLYCHDLCKNNTFNFEWFLWVVYWPKGNKHVVNMKQVLFCSISIFYGHMTIKKFKPYKLKHRKFESYYKMLINVC